MNCLKCKSKISTIEQDFGTLRCVTCNSEYLVVGSIPLMVNEQSDFYRYNRKFRRLVDLKNEQNKD